MDWLLDNFLANMQGTNFLIFYAISAGVVLAGDYFFINALDSADGRPPPATPSAADPYELAYLRGGTNEVVRTAIYALRQKGLIEIAEKTGRIASTCAETPELTDIERSVFAAISPTPKIAALFADEYLRRSLEGQCGAYQQRLSSEQLLASSEVRRAAGIASAVAAGLLLALAGYKAWVATMRGHSNLGFLFLEAAAACVVVYWIFRKATAGNASKRGKAFLAQVQLAYSDHLGALFGAAADGAAGRAAIGGSALLMVGLFGFGILKGTPDAALAKMFAQSSGSGGDGGGCGGGGGGGGCGGCGGGGH